MYMDKQQYKRTKVLIEELIKLRANTEKPKFQMKNWMSEALKKMASKVGLHKAIMDATKNPCGTTCCLAGKAGLIPRIRRMGFKWDVRPGPVDAKHYSWSAQPWARACFQFDGWTGDAAARKFFGDTVFEKVFMNVAGIRTLLQGIKALQYQVEQYEDNQAYLDAQ